jgi:cyclophilin family peptidyl-prolyl cis-trans isomerase
VREAALALKGSTDTRALPALLDNFDRLSRERRENAHDPRMAILGRITEFGSSANNDRMAPYLTDFDSLVATTVAKTLSGWSGTVVSAHPIPLPIVAEPLAATLLLRHVDLLVTMADGGKFTVRLDAENAPATTARILRLVRAHFYDGHVFQRVEPNFVVQGGGPDASEYMGDAQFMRDELSPRSHLRGTLGISSRGRDTGDAQWFFNLVDNTRLDHEYTVFGEVIAGEDVVERIVEGSAIRSVVRR